VLRAACQAAAGWSAHHPTVGPLRVSVNVSGRQLEDPGLVDDVAQALADAKLDPSRLVIEITETALMHNVQTALAQLQALKALGVRLAVDDFGTGYSSLSYLRQFPVDIVKIDKSFIDGVTCGGDDATFLEAILRLGEALNLGTVAEGIETEDQADALRRVGCQFGQGYLFARPLDPVALDAYLRDWAEARRPKQLAAPVAAGVA
jgi:EAL domain-containing protein (putative c-di-GMP-specific phosphodiesterase class I)